MERSGIAARSSTLGSTRLRRFDAPQFDLNKMLGTVVDQWNAFIGAVGTVQRHAGYLPRGFAKALDSDMVDGVSKTVVDFVVIPFSRYTGFQTQMVPFQLQPQQGFHGQAIHPARRPGIPGPPPPGQYAVTHHRYPRT